MLSNLSQAVTLLFLVAPGFLYARAYLVNRRYYYRERSAFEQTVASLIASTIIHILLLGLFSLAWGLSLRWSTRGLPSLQVPLEATIFVKYGMIAFYVLCSLIVAQASGSFFGRRASASLWPEMLIEQAAVLGQFPPRLVVQLRNGDRCRGTLFSLSPVGDKGNTIEFALRDAIYTSQGGGDPLQQRLIMLKSSDVLWVDARLRRLARPPEIARPEGLVNRVKARVSYTLRGMADLLDFTNSV